MAESKSCTKDPKEELRERAALLFTEGSEALLEEMKDLTVADFMFFLNDLRWLMVEEVHILAQMKKGGK